MSPKNMKLYPEWAEQIALWVGWPCMPDYWGEAFDGARDEIASFVRTLAPFTKVHLGVRTEADAGFARRICGPDCSIHVLPMGDIWFRDTGPIFAAIDGVPTGLQFGFNGWGGKFIMPGDEATGAAIVKASGMPARCYDFILEGGAIDFDGEGRVLTTRDCLLNPNRNIWTEQDAEAALKSAFGVGEIIWLDDGLVADHTDGHVDNVARFIGAGHVACQSASGPDDPNAGRLDAIERTLRKAGLKVTVIPSPGRMTGSDGALLAASHVNFVFANGLVIMPRYETVYSEQARSALAQALPDFEVIALDANHVLTGGGSFHCISQQVPKFVSDKDAPDD